MLVIIANHLPDAVRGILKVWCVEPRPNIFVTDINQRTEGKIINFLHPYLKQNSGLVMINSNKATLQGFTITQLATPDKRCVCMSGLQLIEERQPFKK